MGSYYYRDISNFNISFILTTSEMIKFYNQYLADQQDGFVSNINSYVESKLKGHPEEEIKEVL